MKASKTAKRDKRVPIYLNQFEANLLDLIAAHAGGLSRSAAIRRLIIMEAQRLKLYSEGAS